MLCAEVCCIPHILVTVFFLCQFNVPKHQDIHCVIIGFSQTNIYMDDGISSSVSKDRDWYGLYIMVSIDCSLLFSDEFIDPQNPQRSFLFRT